MIVNYLVEGGLVTWKFPTEMDETDSSTISVEVCEYTETLPEKLISTVSGKEIYITQTKYSYPIIWFGKRITSDINHPDTRSNATNIQISYTEPESSQSIQLSNRIINIRAGLSELPIHHQIKLGRAKGLYRPWVSH